MSKLTDLTAITTPDNADLTIVVDVSDTTMDATGTNKQLTWANLLATAKTYFDTLYQASGTYLTSANIVATITNGVTTNAPSEDAVFDALALKAPLISPSFTTPSLGVATATSINGATITSGTLNGSVTGTNTGDQTSIVGITGTMAQFDTAVSDGNIVYQSQALGTPLSGTLTNCTGLPVNGIVDDTTSALGVGTLELGHASDTTLSRSAAGVLAVEGVVIPSISSTNTITNKRNQPRVVSAASYTTDTGTSLDFSTCDVFVVTAQAGALKFNNPSGTPVHGEKIIIRVKDNGTARALTYDTQYRAIGVTLPTTTVISKTTYLGGIWNATDSKVDVIAVATEA